MMKYRVRDLLARRSGGNVAYFVREHWTVQEAARYMSERDIGAVTVLDAQDQVVGVFSERDLLKRVIAPGKDPRVLKVRDVMTREVVTADPDETLDACIEKMKAFRCRHLPIVDAGAFRGMISMRDLMEWIVQDQEDELRFMRSYITHVPPEHESIP